MTKGINLLNNSKKNVKKINVELPKTNIGFSGIINRKDTKNMDETVTEDLLSILHNFIHPSLNSDFAQVQALLTVCRRFAMVKISDNESRKANGFFAKNLLKYVKSVTRFGYNKA